MKAYEIQTFQEGKWKIDSVFDDRDLALFEARRVDEGNRYAGVRVIEEIYDEASDLTTTRTIFRGSRADRNERARKAAAASRNAARAPRAATKDPTRRARAAAKPTATSFMIPILILSVLVIAGLAALFGLQQLAALR